MLIPFRWFLLLAALALSPIAARAEAVYPTGSRIGLAPPTGLVASESFTGFEDRSNNVAVILVELPTQAYADLEKTFNADGLRKQGVRVESREALSLPTGKALLFVGRQDMPRAKARKWVLLASSPVLTALVTVQMPEAARGRYPDAAVRAALASLAVRATIPVDEQLSLLPFKVGELSGFKVAGLIPGRAVMLSDAAAEKAPTAEARIEPHIFVAVAAGGPTQSTDRDHFARDVFATVPNLTSVRITASEALRIGGAQGHQIFANAKNPAAPGELSVVQWLRFGGGGYLQMIGVARIDDWRDAYPRFRSVRDGIEPR